MRFVTSSGRSVVQASQHRKSRGLCKVQIGQVQPDKTGGGEGDSGFEAGAGARATGGRGAVAALLGFADDFFASASMTSRLIGRDDCLAGGALGGTRELDDSALIGF
jgi:hypothetical protein